MTTSTTAPGPTAVFSDRGRQYTAKPGATLRLAKRSEKPGEKVTFDHVLLVSGSEGATAGAPEVSGAKVEATVVRHGRAKKIVVYKIKRRKGYRRKQGHRQDYTDVRIDAVTTA